MNYDPNNSYVGRVSMYGERINAIQLALKALKSSPRSSGVEWLRKKLKMELQDSQDALTLAKELRDKEMTKDRV